MFPAVSAELTRLVPRARVEVLAGVGHTPHATHPDAWAATMSAFHDRVATGERFDARASP